ncbi:hypothetical protein TIFTF001_010754 [Ficus carica]|uniref:Cyclin-dependent protein kinase inhibitor SMR6 n=1 Tax=Ficus carica TaxID=3494 RepID=A0AA88AK52_FICCA|nr:hypothetical protein TIFTF001_010754 [Ficus carica]
MGISEKHQVVDLAAAAALDSDKKKWLIAGIPLRAPLKPIYTAANNNPARRLERDCHDGGEDGEEEECSVTTPTGEEARIPTRLTCPPAPRKSKASLKCNYGAVREFFTPPHDLETVFIRHVERAK